MFTYYKMLTISVAFFTTAILNTPNGKSTEKRIFRQISSNFAVFWGGIRSLHPMNGTPRSVTGTPSTTTQYPYRAQ